MSGALLSQDLASGVPALNPLQPPCVLSTKAVMARQAAGGVWVVLGESGSSTVPSPGADPALEAVTVSLGRAQLPQFE